MCKLSYQTFIKICNHTKNYDFSILHGWSTPIYIIGKLEHANLVLGDRTNVKAVGAHSQQEQKQKGNSKCAFCSGNHKATDCTKYKTVQVCKDRVVSQRLCFNCLGQGHPSKNCRSKRMCCICHLHHNTSLCNQNQSDQTSQSSGDTSQPSKNNQSSSSSHGSQQQQQHPQLQQHQQVKPSQNHQEPVVTQHKSNTQKQHASAPPTYAHVTNTNVSNFPHNVLPTATLDISYCHTKTFTRPFFDTGSQRSFVSPELVKKLNLPVIEEVPVHLSTFGNDTTLHHFNFLVKIKVQMGKRRIPIKLLVHDSASMGYLNCLGIHNVVRMLETQGHQLANRNITSDALTGIELLIGVDYFANFISRQK